VFFVRDVKRFTDDKLKAPSEQFTLHHMNKI